MRRALALLSCATALGLVTATRTASADEPRLEIDLTAGLVRRNGLGGDPKVSPDDPVQPETGGAPPTFSSSTRNGGLGGAVTVLFRSRYFLSPLVDLAYYPLSSTDRVLDLGAGPERVLNRARAVGFGVGFAFDFLRYFRASAALGTYAVTVKTWTRGAESSTTESDFTYVLGLSAFPVVRDRVRVGLGARVGLVVEGEIGFVIFGATIGADAITF